MMSTDCLLLESKLVENSKKIERKPNFLFPCCYKCRQVISDGNCMSLGDGRLWHTECLKCGSCNKLLDGDKSCYAKDGEIFCRKDYTKKFYEKEKSQLQETTAKGGEEIEKTKYLLCYSCQKHLKRNDLIIQCPNVQDVPNDDGAVSIDYRNQFRIFHQNCFSCVLCDRLLKPGDAYCLSKTGPLCFQHILPNNNNLIDNLPEGSEADKFRSIDTASLNGSKENSMNDDENTYDSNDLYYMSGSSRQKRMRTSFKHHQLKTMKAYFSMNHNPDAKDLKSLSEKTGLSKRVLQVWFQNARAKYRRSLMRNEASNGHSQSQSKSCLSEDHVSNTSSNNLDQNLADLTKFSRIGGLMENLNQDLEGSDYEMEDMDDSERSNFQMPFEDGSLSQTSSILGRMNYNIQSNNTRLGSNEASTDEDSQEFDIFSDTNKHNNNNIHNARSFISYFDHQAGGGQVKGETPSTPITSVHLYALNKSSRSDFHTTLSENNNLFLNYNHLNPVPLDPTNTRGMIQTKMTNPSPA